MSDLITMTCPSCGAKLRVAADAAALLCGHCGNEFRVRNSEGTTYLAPMAQNVRQIRVSSDKTAAELALPRLAKELDAIAAEIVAAKARVYMYTVPMKPRAIPYGIWLGFGTLLTFVLAIVGLFLSNIWLILSMSAITCGLVLWYLVLNTQSYGELHREEERLKQAEIARLQGQYNAKKAAIERNRQIADS